MAIESYYGSQSGTTFAEIYSVPDDDSGKVVHRQFKDQEAYDFWHLSYYVRYILECAEVRESGNLSFAAIPRKEKFLLCYLMLASAPEINRITELGSSVYEMIDGLELVKEVARITDCGLPVLDLTSYTYLGAEISDMLSLASRVLHKEYNLKIQPALSKLPAEFGFSYDRAVSNYAFETPAELAEFVNRSEVSFLNTYFSLGETFMASRLGKQTVYFSLDETLDLLVKPLFHLFGDRAPRPVSGHDIAKGRPVLEAFFVAAEEPFIERFMNYSGKHPQITEYFVALDIRPKNVREVRFQFG